MNPSLPACGDAIIAVTVAVTSFISAECHAGLVTVTHDNPLEVSFRDLPYISSNPNGYMRQGGVGFTLNASNQLDAGESLVLELFNDESFVSRVSFGAIGNQLVFDIPTDSFSVAVIDAFQNGVGAIRLTAVGTTSVTLDSVYVQIISPGSWRGGFINLPTPSVAALLALGGFASRRRRE